ncbi:hypothetical protein V6N13_044823 [Hibiscus sabdariffa]
MLDDENMAKLLKFFLCSFDTFIALNPFYRVERICKPDKTLSYPLFPSTPPLNALDVPVLGGQLFLPYPDPRCLKSSKHFTKATFNSKSCEAVSESVTLAN